MMPSTLKTPLLEALFPLNTTNQLQVLLQALSEELVRANTDLRTAGTQKAQHRLAEALQCDSWQQLLDRLTRLMFMRTMMDDYQVSESYADAAYLSLATHQRTSGDGVAVARNYARRFNLSIQMAHTSNTTPVAYGQSSKQVALSQDHLEHLLDAIDLDECDDLVVRGSEFLLELALALSSETTVYISVDPRNRRVVKGQVRSISPSSSEVGVVELTKDQCKRVADQFHDDIMDLINQAREL